MRRGRGPNFLQRKTSVPGALQTKRAVIDSSDGFFSLFRIYYFWGFTFTRTRGKLLKSKLDRAEQRRDV